LLHFAELYLAWHSNRRARFRGTKAHGVQYLQWERKNYASADGRNKRLNISDLTRPLLVIFLHFAGRREFSTTAAALLPGIVEILQIEVVVAQANVYGFLGLMANLPNPHS